MLKDVKFPEIENVSKMPSSCPKVGQCLQKRVNGLEEISKKFAASETALRDFSQLEQLVLSNTILSFVFCSCKL